MRTNKSEYTANVAMTAAAKGTDKVNNGVNIRSGKKRAVKVENKGFFAKIFG